MSAIPTGTDLIRQQAAHLPRQPGVYRMLSADGAVLYVGKARDLKNRVASYATPAGKNQRLAAMIAQTAALEFTTTRNESEALLLEANLIKKLEPRYNILLRDDKSFPFLLMTAHDFPQIRKYRGRKRGDGDYFGPFASAGSLNEVITQLQRAFLLRPCSDNYFNSRSRPCLQYQIKRCSAPCVDYIGRQDYAALVKQAQKFLRGESRQVQDALLAEMQQASAGEQYERAAILRDRLKALTQIQQEQGLHAPNLGDADLLAVVQEKGRACVQVFFYRDGQNYGNQPHFLRNADAHSEAEILAAFIPQFYADRPPPKLLLLSHEPEEKPLLEEALSGLAGHKVALSVPRRGGKAELLRQALRNARQALRRHLDARMGQQEMLEKLAVLFNLPAAPERIEVYDNSHISGSHAVGAMIVAGADGFLKNQYRKFNIKVAEGDDDYAMMREVMTRRLKSEIRSRKSEAGNQDHSDFRLLTSDLLILIDGGKGQLSAVQEAMEEMGLWGVIPVVAIAKGPDRHAGREKFFVPQYPKVKETSPTGQGPARSGRGSAAGGGASPPIIKKFSLPIDDPVLHYLQRLRDEAHRYAIGSHRARRSAQIRKSALDSIPGIGAKRKKALLHHFGSAKAVANASMEELSQVEGISRAVAQKIWGWFHG